MDSSHTNDDPLYIRRTHPLIVKLKQVRKRHRKKLVDVEACMSLPFGTLKQIEQGRRPLPPLISLTGGAFSNWFENWLTCVGASAEEQEELEDLLMFLVIGRFRRTL